ncbi:MAG: hypothetical protein J0L93_00355 [Deltaproteobacteria bacterium]|nr:hypothetical protein [Deltaproteobacteria bacterium]
MANAFEKREFVQGVSLRVSDADFYDGLRAVVDYRGDCKILLKDGSEAEGYIFNFTKLCVDLIPVDSEQRKSFLISNIAEIIFSGADAAAGKSWEDWMKRKAAQKSHQAASSDAASHA